MRTEAIMQTLDQNKPSSSQLYLEGYFDDFIGHYVHVDCGSWPVEFAEKTWGTEFQLKTIPGEICQVRQNRNTGLPLFNIHFSETRNTYIKLDLDYVLKYSMEVQLKYHQLKADRIVYLSKQPNKPFKAASCNRY